MRIIHTLEEVSNEHGKKTQVSKYKYQNTLECERREWEQWSREKKKRERERNEKPKEMVWKEERM